MIKGRRLRLNAEALGFGVTVFLGVKLAAKGRAGLEDFERAATAIPEVQTVQHVLGLYDYRLRVVARDSDDFARIHREHLARLPGIAQMHSSFSLRTVCKTTALPIAPR